MKHRHRARRLALQALCCLDAQGDEAMELALGFIRDSNDPVEVVELAERMTVRAWAHRPYADQAISKRSQHWIITRMPVVDRNILRLAAWELVSGNAPPKVVINEAVRLAKEFSTAESPRFINGVLDALAKPEETNEDDSAQS